MASSESQSGSKRRERPSNSRVGVHRSLNRIDDLDELESSNRSLGSIDDFLPSSMNRPIEIRPNNLDFNNWQSSLVSDNRRQVTKKHNEEHEIDKIVGAGRQTELVQKPVLGRGASVNPVLGGCEDVTVRGAREKTCGSGKKNSLSDGLNNLACTEMPLRAGKGNSTSAKSSPCTVLRESEKTVTSSKLPAAVASYSPPIDTNSCSYLVTKLMKLRSCQSEATKVFEKHCRCSDAKNMKIQLQLLRRLKADEELCLVSLQKALLLRDVKGQPEVKGWQEFGGEQKLQDLQSPYTEVKGERGVEDQHLVQRNDTQDSSADENDQKEEERPRQLKQDLYLNSSASEDELQSVSEKTKNDSGHEMSCRDYFYLRLDQQAEEPDEGRSDTASMPREKKIRSQLLRLNKLLAEQNEGHAVLNRSYGRREDQRKSSGWTDSRVEMNENYSSNQCRARPKNSPVQSQTRDGGIAVSRPVWPQSRGAVDLKSAEIRSKNTERSDYPLLAPVWLRAGVGKNDQTSPFHERSNFAQDLSEEGVTVSGLGSDDQADVTEKRALLENSLLEEKLRDLNGERQELDEMLRRLLSICPEIGCHLDGRQSLVEKAGTRDKGRQKSGRETDASTQNPLTSNWIRQKKEPECSSILETMETCEGRPVNRVNGAASRSQQSTERGEEKFVSRKQVREEKNMELEKDEAEENNELILEKVKQLQEAKNKLESLHQLLFIFEQSPDLADFVPDNVLDISEDSAAAAAAVDRIAPVPRFRETTRDEGKLKKKKVPTATLR